MKLENKSKNNKMNNLDVCYENLKQTWSEKSNKIDKEYDANGITLIALVVTIVVMLVLAGVSINLLSGDNGVINQAKAAINKTLEKQEQEEDDFVLSDDKVKEGLTGTKIIEGAPIPEGFYYVGGVKNKGVVISDNEDDEENYAFQENVGSDLKGNQWVWVPVENPKSLYKENSEGLEVLGNLGIKTYIYSTGVYTKNSLPGNSPGTREPDTAYYYDNDDRAKEAGFTDLREMSEAIVKEYAEMIESIEKYNGFFIGRHELSENGGKKGNTLRNQNWYYMYKTCKELIDNESSKSSMVWGVQWDAACIWLKKCGYNIDDSTFWGNYEKNEEDEINIKATGENEKWKANNIYDLAGNCMEWTQETCNVIHRTVRDSRDGVANDGIVNRNSNKAPMEKVTNLGTRAILILK